MCRDTNIKVMTILNEIQSMKKEDVTEFITTVQLVQITINGVLKNNQEFKFDYLKDMQTALLEYESMLIQNNETSKLLRILASSRLRKKIEQANSRVHQKLEKFRESIRDSIFVQENKNNTIGRTSSANLLADHKISRSGSMNSMTSGGNGEENEEAVEQEAESRMRLAVMIEDQDGKALWSELFGLEAFMVEWDAFMIGLKKVVTDVKPDEEIVLQFILDSAGTGYINQHKFSEFLKGFGPVQDCVKNVRSICSSKWCYGFLTRNETEQLLRDQAPGTFLIRFSSSVPGSFALAFVQANKQFFHILINSMKPLGFQVQEQESQSARTFQNLHELVDYYSIFLQVPFASEIPFDSFFEGDMSGSETNDSLVGHPPGTFLIRFSSQIGNYAVSFVGGTGQINHSLIEHENVPGNLYRIVSEGQTLVFNSLKEVVNHYGDTLKFPLKEDNSDRSVEAYRIIMHWKKERAKQMEAVDKIVAQLFDVNKALPPVVKKYEEKDARVDSIVSRLFSTL